MKKINELKLIFDSKSINESFSRMAVSAFAAQLDMTVEELGDIKTVVSEAVTNAIVHAYPDRIGKIVMKMKIRNDRVLELSIRDWGCGIENVVHERKRGRLFSTPT